jgi:hypothetical protein
MNAGTLFVTDAASPFGIVGSPEVKTLINQ